MAPSPAATRARLRLAEMPEWLAPLWLLGRRRRSGKRVMAAKAQIVADVATRLRVPGHMPSPSEARAQIRNLVALWERPHPPLPRKEELTVPGPAGPLGARLYAARPAAEGPLPVVAYYHGGGWIQGDLDTHDAFCGKLALAGECLVVALDYRLAPEHKFPAAVEDCLAAFRWLVGNAMGLGGDVGRIAVAGDSSGGNLAAVVAQQTHWAGEPTPFAQVLIYPATDLHFDSPSHREFAADPILPRDRIQFYLEWYLNQAAERADLRASPGLAEDLSGLAPAYVMNCGFDPLRDEAAEYARRLEAAGVETVHREWSGLMHACTVLTAVMPAGDFVIAEIGTWLREVFGRTG